MAGLRSAQKACKGFREEFDSPKSSTPRPKSRYPKELIDRTRHLMERTIEFVPHSDFERPNVIQVMRKLRPGSLDQPRVYARTEPGVAFVSGLVQAPLLSHDEEVYWFTWMNFVKFRAERNRRLLDLSHPDRKLVARIEADIEEARQARNHIVQGNVRLIIALAKKLTGSIEEMSDLISEGMSPLIRAVELFDISLGNRFSTYATWAIRNQMLRYLKRARNLLDISAGEESPSLENLPDRESATLTTEAAQEMRMEAVRRLLSSLSEREREIVTARFALDGQPIGQSLADIAGRMGLSKERVRQIALSSLTKLRESMSYDEFEAIS